jgi:hypothetical protein
MNNTISAQQNNSSFNKVFNKLLKQVLKKIKKTSDNLTIVGTFFSSVFGYYSSTLPMPIITSIWIARAYTRGGDK